jgi:hypothetical protein
MNSLSNDYDLASVNTTRETSIEREVSTHRKLIASRKGGYLKICHNTIPVSQPILKHNTLILGKKSATLFLQ